MLELNPKQLALLNRRLESANRSFGSSMNRLIDLAEDPGQFSRELCAYGESLMELDKVRRDLTEILAFTTDPKCHGTLDSLIQMYEHQIMNWNPRSTSNVLSNRDHEAQLATFKTVRGILVEMKGL